MDKLEMSRRQEETLAKVTGGRKTKGSGSQWTDQTDVRDNRLDVEFAFATECKSTGGQSIAVDRKMLAKVIEQAGGERPALALRIYANDRYDVLYDWVAVPLADFAEMVEKLNHPAALTLLQTPDWDSLPPEEMEKFRQQFEEAWARNGPLQPIQAREAFEVAVPSEAGPTMDEHRELMNQYAVAEAGRRDLEDKVKALQHMIATAEAESPLAMAVQLGAAQNDIRYLRGIVGVLRQQAEAGSGRRNELQANMAAPPPARPDGTPKLPWSVVFKDTMADGKPRVHLVHYDATGVMTTREIPEGAEVRVGPIGAGSERALFVDGARIRAGQLYVNGSLLATIDPDEFISPAPSAIDQS